MDFDHCACSTILFRGYCDTGGVWSFCYSDCCNGTGVAIERM